MLIRSWRSDRRAPPVPGSPRKRLSIRIRAPFRPDIAPFAASDKEAVFIGLWQDLREHREQPVVVRIQSRWSASERRPLAGPVLPVGAARERKNGADGNPSPGTGGFGWVHAIWVGGGGVFRSPPGSDAGQRPALRRSPGFCHGLLSEVAGATSDKRARAKDRPSIRMRSCSNPDGVPGVSAARCRRADIAGEDPRPQPVSRPVNRTAPGAEPCGT